MLNEALLTAQLMEMGFSQEPSKKLSQLEPSQLQTLPPSFSCPFFSAFSFKWLVLAFSGREKTGSGRRPGGRAALRPHRLHRGGGEERAWGKSQREESARERRHTCIHIYIYISAYIHKYIHTYIYNIDRGRRVTVDRFKGREDYSEKTQSPKERRRRSFSKLLHPCADTELSFFPAVLKYTFFPAVLKCSFASPLCQSGVGGYGVGPGVHTGGQGPCTEGVWTLCVFRRAAESLS